MPTATALAVSEVARIRGVRAAVLASESDALCIASVSHVDVDVEALAAFATSVVRRAHQASSASGFGDVRVVALDAVGGRVVAAVRDDLILVALADPESHPGLLRLTLQKSLQRLP